MTCIFSTVFKDDDDIVIGKVFMQVGPRSSRAFLNIKASTSKKGPVTVKDKSFIVLLGKCFNTKFGEVSLGTTYMYCLHDEMPFHVSYYNLGKQYLNICMNKIVDSFSVLHRLKNDTGGKLEGQGSW